MGPEPRICRKEGEGRGGEEEGREGNNDEWIRRRADRKSKALSTHNYQVWKGLQSSDELGKAVLLVVQILLELLLIGRHYLVDGHGVWKGKQQLCQLTGQTPQRKKINWTTGAIAFNLR